MRGGWRKPGCGQDIFRFMKEGEFYLADMTDDKGTFDFLESLFYRNIGQEAFKS